MAQEIDITKKIEQQQPEQKESAEVVLEQANESVPSDQAANTTPPSTPIPITPARPGAIPPPPVDDLQKEVENVLSENLKDIYKQLPADKKKTFREHGEVVARSVSTMMRGGVMQIKKVLKLIRDWLLIIPGVNKFFLEQEAKIKTDKIKVLYDRQHK